MTLSWSVFKTFIVKTQYFVEQAPGAQGIAQVYKTPICLAPASFPPLVVTCLWLILDCSQIVPLVNDANKRHSLALLISPVCPHCLLNNRSYFLQMTTYMYLLNSWGWPKDTKTWEWVIYHFNLHSPFAQFLLSSRQSKWTMYKRAAVT